MAYIGKDLNNLGDVQTLDNITFNAGAGPYNLQNGGVQVTNADTASIMISIDGVVQGGNYTVNGSAGTITFDFSVSSGSVCNFVKLFGTGVQLTPKDNSVTTIKVASAAITDAKIDTVAASKLTGALPAISGASLTNLPSETKPTITSTSLVILPTTATSVTIAGTNFASSSTVLPIVEAVTSGGVLTRASVVSWSSATSISATFNLAQGDYRIRVENPDGNAVISANAILQATPAPTWTTSAGNISTIAGGASIGTLSVVASSDSAVTYAKTSGTLPNGISINSSGVFSGTESGSTATTVYSFDVTTTDAEAQTAVRTFTITISHGATGGGQFN